MSTRIFYAPLLFAAILGLLQIPLTAQDNTDDEKNRTVREILIKGLEFQREDLIRAKLKTKEGDTFDRSMFEQDLKRLYKTGFVRKVTWERENLDNGIRIILQIDENPRIQKVQIRGVKEFAASNLKKNLQLPSANTLTPYLLNRDKQKIIERYRKQGFHFVEVNHRLLPGKAGRILILQVVEGPQVVVDSVRVLGTDQFTEGEIIDVLDSEPSWLFGSTKYRETMVSNDVQKIRIFYRRHGYLDVEAYLEEVEFSPDKTEVRITFRVKEGPQYRIKSVQFNGNTLFSRDRLLKEISLKAGRPLELRNLQGDIQSIRDLYGRNAYIDTEVDWHYQVATEKNRVISIFEITEHGKTRAGRIDITGNTKTQDQVIRRHLSVLPGQPINLVKMRRSLNRLRETRYFDQVSIEKEDTELPSVKDLEVKVRERSTGRIRFGAGFSSNFGAIGTLQIRQDNFDISRTPESFGEILSGKAFAGGGQQLDLTLQPGVERSTYSLKFREPFVYDQPLGLGFRGFSIDRERDDFDEGRTGLDINWDYRDAPWTFELALEGENIDITNVDSGSPADLLDIEGDNTLYSFIPGVTLDRREPRFLPASGYFFKTSYEHTIGDFDFGKVYFDARKYFTIFEQVDGGKHILSFRGRVGLGESYGNRDIPTFERYYAGGTRSIRGFDYRGVGPQINDVEIGGEAMWIANGEYTFPLLRTRRRGRKDDLLRGALFVDAGSVSRRKRDFENDIRYSVGFGFRIKIPGFGPVPVKLDIGFPIQKEDGDDTQTLHFDFGASF